MQPLLKTLAAGALGATLVVGLYEGVRLPRLKTELLAEVDARLDALRHDVVRAAATTAATQPVAAPPHDGPKPAAAPADDHHGDPHDDHAAHDAEPDPALLPPGASRSDGCHCPPQKAFDAASGKCVAPAEQTVCPVASPDSAVVGCDGQRYASECLAHARGIMRLVAPKVVAAGDACRCPSGQIWSGKACTEAPDDLSDCPAQTGLPLCGCDGTVYPSLCDAQRHGIKTTKPGLCATKGTTGDPETWPLADDACKGSDKPRLVLALGDGSFVLQRADGTMLRSATQCP